MEHRENDVLQDRPASPSVLTMRPSLVAQDQCWRLKCQSGCHSICFWPNPVSPVQIHLTSRAGLCRPCPGDRFVQLLIINLKRSQCCSTQIFVLLTFQI